MIRSSRAPERLGFALPAVLAVTGVVTLIFLVAMTALSSLTAEAASARARMRFMTRAMTAEAMIAYMAATEPTAPTGFNTGAPRIYDDMFLGLSDTSGEPVRLDGRGYQADGEDLLITLRDQAGMINIPYLTDAGHQRLGEALGVDERSTRTLIPLYRDYIDQDDLELPNGAEASSYGAGGPANRVMRRPDEWLSLLGLRGRVKPDAWRRLRSDLAMDPTSPSENVNTASAQALHILYGATPAQAEAAIRAREQQPFQSFSAFAAATGLPDTSGEGFYTYPSGRVLLTLADSRSAWVYRARITLTPSGLERPVWIDQTELREAPGRAVADLSNAVRFPYAPR
ncbi:general secretion pathway protein GspK [Brevundimonas sp. PAMC22021]|uniref:general secretion pathway protein GspK n=1 Tax=Brevundimonas sp. PAMC22021 TaxID=2861285 RepID=UPI001C62CB89|nr:type II secretion system protein GspK [Brevundimonas sp. PAMC22021]QYF86440.1 general secretion pathway protein GspK [Brevundimonas sp. PAMC22021]